MSKRTYIILISILLLGLSACTSKDKKSLIKSEVERLASIYSFYYNDAHYNYQPVIVTYKDQRVQEVTYIDERLQRIAVRIYERSPYDQFLELINENNGIAFDDAYESVESKLLNYFASDCSSIEKALTEYKRVDLNYKHGDSYSYNPGKAIYNYLFVERDNGGQTVEISTHIAEHPISEIYRIAKKGVEDCPHPTEPPEVGPIEYRPLPTGD